MSKFVYYRYVLVIFFYVFAFAFLLSSTSVAFAQSVAQPTASLSNDFSDFRERISVLQQQIERLRTVLSQLQNGVRPQTDVSSSPDVVIDSQNSVSLSFDTPGTEAARDILRVTTGISSTIINDQTDIRFDIDGDGRITTADALNALRVSVGLEACEHTARAQEVVRLGLSL